MPERNLVDQKFSETDQKFPETGQLFFWATKKNEKKTGQLVHQETDQTTWTGLWLTFVHTGLHFLAKIYLSVPAT